MPTPLSKALRRQIVHILLAATFIFISTSVLIPMMNSRVHRPPLLDGRVLAAAEPDRQEKIHVQTKTVTFSVDPYPTWIAPQSSLTQDGQWGDVDGDGDLDLAVANSAMTAGNNFHRSLIYLNQNGVLPTSADQVIFLAEGNATAVAWADVDNDGDLDLALAFRNSANLLYINNGLGTDGKPILAPVSLGDTDASAALAWGDVNGDGFMDLAVGNICQPNKIYLNNQGTLQTNSPITFGDFQATVALDWADMDKDGDLDLAVGDTNDSTILTDSCSSSVAQGYASVYRNNGGTLESTPYWQPYQPSAITQVAWGDMNGDDLPELAISNFSLGTGDGNNSVVYRNIFSQENDFLFDNPPLDLLERPATDVQWGDVEGDGDLDLLLANNLESLIIFLNEDGAVSISPDWLSETINETTAVDWGDMDNDGDLDIAVLNKSSANAVLQNHSNSIQNVLTIDNIYAAGLAWGDMDNDGDLDLASGTSCVEPAIGTSKVFRNQAGTLSPVAAWSSADASCSLDVAWGDMNGDGLLDLAVAGDTVSRVYLNTNGLLQSQPAWTSTESATTFSVAWGDVDGDGDLDLAVGGMQSSQTTQRLRLYRNINGMLEKSAFWSSDLVDVVWDLAWGDVDADGDLDLAVAGLGPVQLFLNQNGTLSNDPSRRWASQEEDTSKGVAWGDADGDGDLDLAVASNETQNKIYFNTGGRLSPTAGWVSRDNDISSSALWTDVDGDGDMDLSITNETAQTDRIYLNANQRPQTGARGTWQSPDIIDSYDQAWGDMNGDGLPDMATGSFLSPGGPFSIRIYRTQVADSARPGLAISPVNLAPADGYAVPGIRQSGTIPITYSLYDTKSKPFGQVRAFYSLDGGGKWYPAVPTAATRTTDLASLPFPARNATNTHTFTWDVAASGFFGQSDNVVVRIEALPSVKGRANDIPGPFHFAKTGSQSYPFRVRGTQVRVYGESVGAANTIPGASVFQLPSDQNGVATAIGRGATIFTTDAGGFLQGRGALGLGDRLIALAPITSTAKYTVYHTSAVPIQTGVNPFTMTTTGVQNLVVSKQNPLMLFNLSVSLEWDARKDTIYLAQLESYLNRASELLYDATNGQAALGSVTVYHDRANWETADIRIHATNRLRPHATIGGSVTEVIQKNLPNGSNPAIQLAFFPGAVEMPVSWNRFGESSGSLGEDWPRALVHEFGHYLFFLLEDYLGFDSAGLPVAVSTCPSLMGNVYLDENSEFHPGASWGSSGYACQSTLQHQTMKRSDWETIVEFYPWLKAPTQSYTNQLGGPSTLPLAVTKINFVDPGTPASTLDVPSYYLIKPDGSRYLASSYARAFRFNGGNLVDLGEPRQDRLQAWGARTGANDRVCVFDLDPSAPAVGCLTVQSGVTRLTVQPTPAWLPDIVVSPVNTETLALTVSNVAAGADLRVRLYAADRAITTTLPAEIRLTYSATAKTYSASLPIHLSAKLHLRDANNPSYELVTDFTLGGAPDLGLGKGFTIRLAPGSKYVDAQGITQTVGAEGAILTLGPNAALQLGSGNALILGTGTSLILGTGNALILGTGTSLILGTGTALILGTGNALILGTGNALILGTGNALILGTGNALILGTGNALILGTGNAAVLEDGNGPVLSSDGQVVLFVDTMNFAPGQFYTLQPATRVPNPPSYATVVGQPYRLAASPGAPAIAGSSLSFRYLGRDVPPGEEKFLKIWFFNEQSGEWTPLTTTLDTVQNSAAATAQGAGLYVLMSSIEIPLRSAGWNLIAYPVQGSRAVTDALSYLSARQSDWWILGYDDTNSAQPWQIYAASPPALTQLGELAELSFGRGYWIHVSQPITLYLRGAENQGRLGQSVTPMPPATFYGRVRPGTALTPAPGMTVQARINGRVCGSGQTRRIDGEIWYLVHVSDDDGAAFAGCGGANRTIQFSVNGTEIATTGTWRNGALSELDLVPGGAQQILLPQIHR